MRRNYFRYALFFSMGIFMLGCAGSTNPDEEESNETEGLIEITQQQFDSENMEIGEVSLQPFEEIISCNGYIAAPPNGMAQISTQISGIVKNIYSSLGDYVKKGQVLCRLSSTELIVLQQDFAETSANLNRLKADWERSKALYEEKIGAEKDYKAIESEYQVTMARYQSLKLRLELLDLNASKIEAGELYSACPIMAPINGYITSQHIVLGQFIEQQKNLMEIVDINQLQLQLSVFENDMKHIEVGQNIAFKSIGESDSIYYATLASIGKTINMETKSIKCIAKINKAAEFKFINNSYIEAKISVSQAEAKALPSESILRSGQDYYVLVIAKSDKQNYYLRKVEVNIGRVSMGFTEIIDSGDLTKVIIKGVYNLQKE